MRILQAGRGFKVRGVRAPARSLLAPATMRQSFAVMEKPVRDLKLRDPPPTPRVVHRNPTRGQPPINPSRDPAEASAGGQADRPAHSWTLPKVPRGPEKTRKILLNWPRAPLNRPKAHASHPMPPNDFLLAPVNPRLGDSKAPILGELQPGFHQESSLGSDRWRKDSARSQSAKELGQLLGFRAPHSPEGSGGLLKCRPRADSQAVSSSYLSCSFRIVCVHD